MSGIGMSSVVAGSAAIEYDLPAGTIEDPNPIPAGNTITLTIRSDGTWEATGDVSGSLGSGSWITPEALAPGTYHIRADISGGGTVSSGTTGSDLALTSDRTWTKTVGAGDDQTVTLDLSLKDASGGTVVASSTVSLRAASA